MLLSCPGNSCGSQISRVVELMPQIRRQRYAPACRRYRGRDTHPRSADTGTGIRTRVPQIRGQGYAPACCRSGDTDTHPRAADTGTEIRTRVVIVLGRSRYMPLPRLTADNPGTSYCLLSSRLWIAVAAGDDVATLSYMLYCPLFRRLLSQ